MTSNGEEEGREEEEEVRTEPFDGGGWRPPTALPLGRGETPSRPVSDDLLDFAALDAAGADPNALGTSRDHRVDRHEVRKPATLRMAVRVADLASDRGTFPADIAALSHDHSLGGSSGNDRCL